MDWERCLFIFEWHGIGPSMHHLIRHFWDMATNLCHALGNYGTPFKMGRGVTQGGPLWPRSSNDGGRRGEGMVMDSEERVRPGGGGAGRDNGCPVCNLSHRQCVSSITGPHPFTTGNRRSCQYLGTRMSQDQHHKDKGNDLHPRQNPAPASG